MSVKLFSFANLSVVSWLDSGGNFSVTVDGRLKIGNNFFGIEGGVHFNITSQVTKVGINDYYIFNLELTGYVRAYIFGFPLGVSLGARFHAEGNGTIPIVLSLSVTIDFFFFSITFSHDFTVGYLELPKPIYLGGDFGLANTQRWSGGALVLNTGARNYNRGIGQNATHESYLIEHLAGGARFEVNTSILYEAHKCAALQVSF